MGGQLYHTSGNSLTKRPKGSNTMTGENVSDKPASSLDANIAAYEKMQDALEEKYMYKWVIFHNEKFVDVYDSLDFAAYHATQ